VAGRVAARCSCFRRKCVNQGSDVFGPLPERRDMQHDNVEAMVQIFAKRAGGHHPGEILIGSRENADVYTRLLIISPTRSTEFSWRTRNSLPCRDKSSSHRFRRGTRCRRERERKQAWTVVAAPVKDPLRWTEQLAIREFAAQGSAI